MNASHKLGELNPSLSVEPPKKLIDCVIEVHTEGERRGLARGRLLELVPGTFAIFPIGLQEICGPRVDWDWPPREVAIAITTFELASDALAWWAMQTMAKCASLHR